MRPENFATISARLQQGLQSCKTMHSSTILGKKSRMKYAGK